MIYHINVRQSNSNAFLQIINSLRSMGVIESFISSGDLVREGEPLDEATLLNILKNSKKEIKEGNSFTMDEVKKQLENEKIK